MVESVNMDVTFDIGGGEALTAEEVADDNTLISPNRIDSQDYGASALPSSQPQAVIHRQSECRTYTRRWLILAIFCCYSAANAYQWDQYVIIEDLITSYYHVSGLAVEWTTMIYMLVYIPGILPFTYMLERYGLRFMALLGSGLNLLGSATKCASFMPWGFPVLLVGQAISGCGQLAILSLPPRIAALWFGSSQVSTATSIGVFGNQVGIALGFILPPLVMQAVSHNIKLGLQIQLFTLVAVNTLLFLLVCYVYRDKPPMPPSVSQAALQSSSSESRRDMMDEYKISVKNLLHDRNYIFLLISYGINVGTFYCISTLLNRIIFSYFSDFDDVHSISGVSGLLIIISGLFAAVICGLILDKTKAYKGVTFIVYAMTVIGMLMFILLIKFQSPPLLYFTSAFLGFFMTGYLPVGFEYAAEITYPEPEGTSSGLLNMSAQVFGITLILTGGRLLDSFSPLWFGIFVSCFLVAGVILTYFTHGDLKRQNVMSDHKQQTGNGVSHSNNIQ